jgi:hypothetical protein
LDWETIKQLWPNLKDLFQSAAIIFSAVTLGFAVFRLPKIVSDLKDGGNEINEKLQSTLKQLTELQRIVADERPAEEVASSNDYGRSNSDKDDSEKNWERIKQYWADIRNYIEEIVGEIQDGRVARRYDGIPRYSYADVISSLADDNFISSEKAAIMLEMNNRFLSLRRRSKQITPDIVQQFEKWRSRLLNG